MLESHTSIWVWFSNSWFFTYAPFNTTCEGFTPYHPNCQFFTHVLFSTGVRISHSAYGYYGVISWQLIFHIFCLTDVWEDFTHTIPTVYISHLFYALLVLGFYILLWCYTLIVGFSHNLLWLLSVRISLQPQCEFPTLQCNCFFCVYYTVHHSLTVDFHTHSYSSVKIWLLDDCC